ncbi:MAG: NAD-dependent epimerase/dehydratase family protein, partial [Thermoanaerobaculia bacterium]
MIVVTGGSGFLGRHVVGALAAGEVPVRALDLRFGDDFAESAPGVEMLRGDFLDGDFLRPALAGADTVVHLASKNVDHDGSGFEQVNVEGTRRLCAVAAAAGVRRLIYVSSVGIYGHGVHSDADESTPVRPDTPFSRSKAAA